MALNTGTYANVETEIYALVRSKGYHVAAASAILANIEAESGFNPGAHNPNDKGKSSYGLCQWRADRREELFRLYGPNPSVKSQIEYLFREVNNIKSYSKTKEHLEADYLDSYDGAYTIGFTFVSNFERPQRMQNGRDIFIERAQRSRAYYMYYKDIPLDSLPVSNNITLSNNPEGSISNIPTYLALSTIDPYSDVLKENLSRMTAEGFDYGYLIDLTYGGEFKFYIPEFSESAGTNWGDVEIPGRSVSIKAYNSTNSRSITVSLDLYASAGLYVSEADPVGDLHRDVNFVKSLEYPDYNGTITTPPANVHLILGSSVNIQGVVHSVQVEHLKPLDSQNRAMYMKLSFTVTQVTANPPGYSDIRGGVSAVISTEDPSTMSQ